MRMQLNAYSFGFFFFKLLQFSFFGKHIFILQVALGKVYILSTSIFLKLKHRSVGKGKHLKTLRGRKSYGFHLKEGY